MNTLLHKAASPATGTTTPLLPENGKATFQAVLKGTGAITATILLEVSNDGENWLTLATFTMAGTTVVTDGAVSDAPWAYVRARLTAITGTSANASVFMGV